MLLFGDPKVGKSYAALQLAACLATGRDWLGFHIPQPRTVVYVQLDTPRPLWADRVEALATSGHPVRALYYADRETLGTFPFDILQPAHFRLLTEELRSITEIDPSTGEELTKPTDVVIIDTLREAHSGDENDSTEMQQVIAYLDAAVKPAALILISHARKSNPEIGYSLMNDNRGSNYIVGRMDGICRFSKESMRVSSRTLEEETVRLDRSDDGTWTLLNDPFTKAVEVARAENPLIPTRELARMLHDRFPSKSEAACRAALRRAKK